jgi:acyl-CoA thioester hydrolase
MDNHPVLSATASVTVRFNETDPLGIAWHGNYLIYFEDGRDAFGKKYGLHYLDIFDNGFLAPLINVNCDYKKMLKYGDSFTIETSFKNTASAKIILQYRLYFPETQEIIATGSTTQVFLDANSRKLQLQLPPFFAEWKKKHNLS